MLQCPSVCLSVLAAWLGATVIKCMVGVESVSKKCSLGAVRMSVCLSVCLSELCSHQVYTHTHTHIHNTRTHNATLSDTPRHTDRWCSYKSLPCPFSIPAGLDARKTPLLSCQQKTALQLLSAIVSSSDSRRQVVHTINMFSPSVTHWRSSSSDGGGPLFPAIRPAALGPMLGWSWHGMAHHPVSEQTSFSGLAGDAIAPVGEAARARGMTDEERQRRARRGSR
mmetsp:Transcript_48825/g.122281  ORF Transcript_48825/g.122281 Transcript_48825/m.122281 type:complete len:224 (-) Transcript_48825:226-897(-)